jgi:hypothetical protein
MARRRTRNPGRGAPLTVRRLTGLVLLLCLTGCEKIATGPDPESQEALFGLWRFTAVGVREKTIEFFDTRTWRMVEVDWQAKQCEAAEGSWAVDVPAVLSLRTTERDGASVSEPTTEVEYFIDSSRLVMTFPGWSPEVFAMLEAEMPTCADYDLLP